MKIALLAPSGAGKTAYLAGLYGVLTEDLSNSNYGVDFELPDRVLRGKLSERYEKLVDNGDFGSGSREMTVYPWTLSTAGIGPKREKLNIELVDFPGGFLHQADETNKAEVERVIQRLSECDGFIILIDGDEVTKKVAANNPRALKSKIKPNDIQEILKKALERRSERLSDQLPDPDAYAFGYGPTPVVFGVTKGDMISAWLAHKPEERTEQLQKGVAAQFDLNAQNLKGYNPQEGAIANLIKSQFGQIIDHPDVCSLRTTVTVYDQTTQSFSPQNLETLLQYVLFVGLHNAISELEHRKREWNKENKERKNKFESENWHLERAKEEHRQWNNQGPVSKFFDWIDGKGKNFHEGRLRDYHADAVHAGERLDLSTDSIEKIDTNLQVASLFYQRVLSSTLIYSLTHSNGQEGFYQQGFPIKEISNALWWRRRCTEGTPKDAPEANVK